MFWKKGAKTGETTNKKVEKLPGPKGIPELVGRYLITELKQNPDQVWNFKAVLRPLLDKGKGVFEFRVLDDTQVAAKKVAVKDYNSLDAHPELILYQGWFNKKTMQVKIEEKKPA